MSAAAEYRRARTVARRRRPLSVLLALVAVTVLAGAGWLRQPPLVAIAAAFAVGAWAVRADSDPERWRRGAAGEVATARLLASLPGRFIVLHDRALPGVAANIDHLVIGPTGVVVVDSKAYRAELGVRHGRVWAGDYDVATEPARWEAERVAQVLGVDVTAIVAVHGSGLRRRGKVVCGVRVIPASRLCRRLRRGRRHLTRANAASLARTVDRALPPATGWRARI